jgi:hypothetical protein
MKHFLFILIPLSGFAYSNKIVCNELSNLQWKVSRNTIALVSTNDSVVYSDTLEMGISHKIQTYNFKTKKVILLQTFENAEYDYIYSAEFIDNKIIVHKSDADMIRNLKADLFYTLDIKSKRDNRWESKLYPTSLLSAGEETGTLYCDDGILSFKKNGKLQVITNEKLVFLNENELKSFWLGEK